MSTIASQNHQPRDCLLNRLFRRRSKKTAKHRVTGLCAGNSPVTGEFPAQRASYAENVSIWWRHHDSITPFQIYHKNIPLDKDMYYQMNGYAGPMKRNEGWMEKVEYGIKVSITLTSHKRNVVSNHRSFDCLFNRLCRPTSKKHQSSHYWPFLRGIHRSPLNSQHKGPGTRE